MNHRALGALAPLVVSASLLGCGVSTTGVYGLDAATITDAGRDAVVVSDAGATDAGRDAGITDAGRDAGTDAGVDAGHDAGVVQDSGSGGMDAGQDAGVIPPVDAGSDAGQVAADSGTGVDAGMDSGTGVDAGMRVWVLEIWGYHVPDTRWTAGYASSAPWDPGLVYPATNPDVVLYITSATPDPDTDTLDRAPTGPRWSTTVVGTFVLSDFGAPTDVVGTCGVSAAEAAAARADGQLRTTTCTPAANYPLLTTGVTPDNVTATWRVVATYR